MSGSLVLVLVSIVSIQVGAAFAKGLFPAAGMLGATGLRVAFASLILLFAVRPFKNLSKGAPLRAVMIYGASLGLMNLTFYLALGRIPLGLAVTLEFIGPLALSLFHSKTRKDLLFAIMAALGVYLIVPKGNGHDTSDSVGILLALIAGGFWASYIYFGKKAGANFKSEVAASLGMGIAALVVIPFAVAVDGPKLLNPAVYPLALGVALLSSALPDTLEMVAMKRLPTQTFGILMSLEPAVAAGVGWMMLGERLDAPRWCAMILIMMASMGSAFFSRESK